MTRAKEDSHGGPENAGLYVHVPFCRSKCVYCDFYSVTDLSGVQEWYKALLVEMTFHGDFAAAFDTVYIGGGTPSCLPSGLLPDLLKRIRSALPVSADAEITVEVNPGDVDASSLARLREAGFNRVSIGVQSFDDGILSFLGRRHGGREALHAIDAARRAGFTNLSVDLIYGIPGQSHALWRRTLETALGFEPEHLSCYELTLERGTPLHCRVETGHTPPPPAEEEAYRFFSSTSIFLEANGFLHYEVSNFARGEDRISRHNHKYWDHSPYLGLGPAAHSFRTNRRWWNHRSLDRYIRDIRQGRVPAAGQEELSQEELQTEALYFGFRTRRGIDGPAFRERYGLDLFAQKGAVLRRMRAEGLIRIDGEFLCPTRSGLAVADRLCLL
ncbi:MAG: radical SAM family heme chaperone HemW [Syntrophaceae bacterium]|nr:radical SAM family heme chaperone HemW [Syntrophaceae bacterium]